MNNYIRLWLSGCVLMSLSFAASGDETTNGFWGDVNKFIKDHNIRIRYSTADKNSIDKPASIQFVSPRDGSKDSYAIDIGLTANLANGSVGQDLGSWEFGPTVEYHKQTQISKAQENFQAGLNSILVLGDETEGMANFLQLSAKYKLDHQKTGNGFLGKLDYTPLYTNLALGFARGPKELKFLWQPTIGIQGETSDDVEKSKQSGEALRGKASIEIGVYPFATTFKKRLELSSKYTYWNNLASSGGFENVARDAKEFTASAIYYIDPDSHIGIGLDYLNGSDPELGLSKQEYVSISLKVKF